MKQMVHVYASKSYRLQLEEMYGACLGGVGWLEGTVEPFAESILTHVTGPFDNTKPTSTSAATSGRHVHEDMKHVKKRKHAANWPNKQLKLEVRRLVDIYIWSIYLHFNIRTRPSVLHV